MSKSASPLRAHLAFHRRSPRRPAPGRLAPADVPRDLTESQVASNPGVALLAALVHGSREGADADTLLGSVLTGLAWLERPLAKRYYQLLTAALGARIEALSEAITMTESSRHYTMEEAEVLAERWVTRLEQRNAAIEARGRAVGEARGRAAAILAVLTARGLSFSEGEAARLQAESSHDVLDRWLVRAVHATAASDVFAE